MALAVDAARVKAAGTAWESIARILPLVVKLGAIAGLSSTIIVQMVAQPRIFMSMAQDGLFPKWAGSIHPRFHTPHVTTIITGLIVALSAGIHIDQRPRRARQHRHALRLCRRRHRRHRLATHASGSGASIPNAGRPVDPGDLRDRVVHPDGRLIGRDVDSTDRLDGDWPGTLRGLWLSAQRVAATLIACALLKKDSRQPQM